MDAREERAWDAFAADVATWVDRAGEHLSAIAHRHGVGATRHELEAMLEAVAGTIEAGHAIEPGPDTATVADVRDGFAEMAARIRAGEFAGDASPAAAELSGVEQWRRAAADTAADAYLDGMAAGARIDGFAASMRKAAGL
ncbi:hypothetical protein [Rhodococcus sp. 14-2470-1a]|uniref:hypothetical protein n=1 Tax=Rhodococcus sp. 14-2470-1a TaxID=2023150 RepID=UPI000B9BEFC5|nr:hypothetical protein [Rhodococcus sp. 14-2470-1a]OZF41885.1 hypothetical protein CH292_27140 [Rhodococcus sp. 14-2470-1a]